jgi:hypothetical protein
MVPAVNIGTSNARWIRTIVRAAKGMNVLSLGTGCGRFLPIVQE